jgi:hypothetical protein
MKRIIFVVTVIMMCFSLSAYAVERNKLCNVGSIPFDFAAAVEVPAGGFIASKNYQVRGWYTINPGHCFDFGDVGFIDGSQRGMNLVFAATDSAGKWGYTRLTSNFWKDSQAKICVKGKGQTFDYKVRADESTRNCASGYVAPASIYYYFIDGRGVDIALSQNLTVTAIGPQETNVDGDTYTLFNGTLEAFEPIFRDTLKRTNVVTPGMKWTVCIDKTVVQLYHWKKAPPELIKSLYDGLAMGFVSRGKDVRIKMFERTYENKFVFVSENYDGPCSDIGYYTIKSE